jgi:hypothetical protein
MTMKTFSAVLAVAALFVIGAVAYAHNSGAGRCGSGHMMEDCGGHMMGHGHDGHMMGSHGRHMMDGSGHGSRDDTQFLDETVDLRKELHEKKFDYFEASRNPETDPALLTKLEKELNDIQSKIREKAPQANYGGYGHCW